MSSDFKRDLGESVHARCLSPGVVIVFLEQALRRGQTIGDVIRLMEWLQADDAEPAGSDAHAVADQGASAVASPPGARAQGAA